MEKVKELAKKWYKKLQFESEYDEEFYYIVEHTEKLTECDIHSYLKEKNENKEKNFIMFLYFCEALAEKYEEKGIPEKILFNSLENLKPAVVETKKKEGILGIDKDAWVTLALKFELFRIERLQFQLSKIYPEAVQYGYDENEKVVDVHIPATGGSITPEVCDSSFCAADEFMKKYFPEYDFRYYTCFSWMLDDTMAQFLDENTNIRKFRNRFTVIHKREQDSVLHFLFKMGIEKREELHECEAKSAFAQKVKDYALSGGKLYNVLGIKER